jgi:class 3 adenylate cyclase/tetratricopeptide (TPR) repeat protein
VTKGASERVECPSCGAENASGRKFCRACGARLSLRCPACGTANEPDDRFCGECGTPFATAAPAAGSAAGRAAEAPIAPVPPAPSSEERRQVTVLFADLVGFTSLAERLDPEDVRDITTNCLRQLAAEAVRFEGTVDKLIGDAVMILFGAPIAHEDDPARALRAALAMQRALERFNQQLERSHGLDLRLRIGVESGEVVAGPREVGGIVEYTVIGDAVNVAARLQTAAEPGSVLVGEATRQRVGSAFRLEDAGPLVLKGRERPVVAAVLLAEGEAGPAPEPRAALVGRSAELRMLLDRLAALRAGRGSAVMVLGAPGLGKSRLLAELRAHAMLAVDSDDALHWARCQAYAHESAQSYGLARSLVRALVGIGTEERDQSAAAQLRAALVALDLPHVEAALLRLLGLPPAGEEAEASAVLDALPPRDLQRRFFHAVVALVDRLAARRPLVLELDDLHWADPTSLDLVLELRELAARARLLVCGAFRLEPDVACQVLCERSTALPAERDVQVQLGPLSEQASAELVARLLGQAESRAGHRAGQPTGDGADARATAAGPDGRDGSAAPLPAALRSLLERAAGTPLWLEELVRALVERGILTETGDGWHVNGDLSAVELPDSLQALIVARIDRLGPARPTIQIASVIGRRFGRTVLERVADAAARLDSDLSQAQRADLVLELPTDAPAGDPARDGARDPAHGPGPHGPGPVEREYDFKHVLVRDAAYATLLHRRRRALHRRVAEAVELLYPERVPELHAVLAYHYERAEEWARAHQHARAAADAARDSFANREAAESYTLALEMAERAGLDGRERGALLEARGSVHERLGDFEAARSDYEAALALAEAPTGQQDASATRVRLLGALGMLWGGHKDYQRGIELTHRAVDLAGSTGDARAQADASIQLAILLLNLLRLAGSRQAVEAALGLYHQLGDAHGEARALDVLGLLACCDGRLDDGERYLRDAYQRFEAAGDRGAAVSSGSMLGVPLLLGGKRLEGERWMRRVIGLAQEIGAPAAEAFAWMILAEGVEPYGAYTRAEELALRAQAIAREIEHREWTLAALGPIGRVRRVRGDPAAALALHQEMVAIARELGAALWTSEALSNVAFDQLVLGDLEAARAASDESIAVGGPYQKGIRLAVLTRIRLLLLGGRPADALTEARAAVELFVEYRVRRPEAMVLEGLSLAALGRPDEAEAAYWAALAGARAVGAGPGLWQAARALGELLVGLGRADEAASLRAAVDAELDALAADLGEPGLRQTLAAVEVA